MNYHGYFAAGSKPVEVCVVGTGAFGQSLMSQARRVPLMSVRVAVDITAERAAEAWRTVGAPARDIALCSTSAEAKAAFANGQLIACGDIACTLDLPVDVVVEGTGHPESGARHARLAVESGRHLVMASKEVDIVIGPYLSAAARQAGRVVTPVDGDQPSLLIGQTTWAETLGFTIVAAGKSSEYDYVYDPVAETVTTSGRTVAAGGLNADWDLGTRSLGDVLASRARTLAAIPPRTVPDLCEMLIAANALDLTPDRPDFHAPILRVSEVPSAFDVAANGGLLSGERRIDVFNCLRRPDELSFAGGVFVVVRCEDAAVWRMLAEKGHVLSRDGRAAMLYLPRHVLGLEAATSILAAGLHGVSTGAETPLPRYDLAARADADLPAGTVLTAEGHHHSIKNVSGWAVPASRLHTGAPIPFYLAANHKLTRPVAKGELIRFGDVEIPEASELLSMRRKQDAHFGVPARH
ncbi:MAG TPA: flagellar biosynthesis protein FlgA [Pseudolabrys sp.]|nr:flagellar biosynthesis protein FlgA [Pseudolabrys sp.]